MELTQEQKDIIQSVYTEDKVIKVNAYAGTGKTSTVIELVKEIKQYNPNARILYTVFNKSMKLEAENKFEALGLDVECQTVHGLALKKYAKLSRNYKKLINTLFSDDYLKVSSAVQKEFGGWINFGQVKKLFEIYYKYTYDLKEFVEYMQKNKGQHKDLDDPVKDVELLTFYRYYQFLLSKGTVTHGMYLKEYSINFNDTLYDWDYVFVDEAQDLNVHMFNIIDRMKYKKIWYFGDTYQQIYGWNNAVNAMEKVNGREYTLSISFRLNNESRELANNLLTSLRKDFVDKPDISNNTDKTIIEDDRQVTYLFRANATMFIKAVELICGEDGDKIKVHFLDVVKGENADSFDKTFEELIYFYYKLLKEDGEFKKLFKVAKYNAKVDNLIKMCNKSHAPDLYTFCLGNMDTLEQDLAKYFKLFNLYRENIVTVLAKMKEAENVENPIKEYWLCTAHRSKGLEWEHVIIAQDNWTFGENDNINLAYVASTRATKKLEYDNLVLSLISNGQKVELPKAYIERLESLAGTDDFTEELASIYNYGKRMTVSSSDLDDEEDDILDEDTLIIFNSV